MIILVKFGTNLETRYLVQLHYAIILKLLIIHYIIPLRISVHFIDSWKHENFIPFDIVVIEKYF